jgi:hypothetical protein
MSPEQEEKVYGLQHLDRGTYIWFLVILACIVISTLVTCNSENKLRHMNERIANIEIILNIEGEVDEPVPLPDETTN